MSTKHDVPAVGVHCDVTSPATVDAGMSTVDRRDHPVGRIGTVTDVADVVEFLCRPRSSHITGATYDVNGGSHIH